MGIKTESGLSIRRGILDALVAGQQADGYLPSITNVARGLGMGRATMDWHLQSLRDQGFVSFAPGARSRTLKLKPKDRALLR